MTIHLTGHKVRFCDGGEGREVYEEAVMQLVRFVTWFKDRPKDARRDLHRTKPTMPMPWGQRPSV